MKKQKIIDTLSSRHFTPEEAAIFKYLTTHFQQGCVSSQVPLIRLEMQGYKEDQEYTEIDFKKAFEENCVVWVTSKGLIRTEECRNPENNRLLSGYMFMTADYVEKHLDLMYEVFCENNQRESTVQDKREFLALMTYQTLFHKAPRGKEKLSEQYLALCEKQYPGQDIIKERIEKYSSKKKMGCSF